MTYLIVSATALVLGAGFLASYLPGRGLGPLWEARLRTAGAIGLRQNIVAARGVARVVIVMTVAGLLRIGTFALGVAMIYTESLYGSHDINEINENEQNEKQGEIEHG